jgi:Pyruvate/2-oxoacid:ferredoxin oxidoreductase delta subunit
LGNSSFLYRWHPARIGDEDMTEVQWVYQNLENLRSDYAKLEEKIKKQKQCIALLNCMIYCGEKHSSTSEQIVQEALK